MADINHGEDTMGLDDARRRTVQLDIKGKSYTMTEFSARDLADFEKHVMEEKVRQFRELSEGMDESIRLKTMSEMIKTGLPDMEILDHMTTMSGSVFLLHRSLSYNHPGLTIEDMGELLDMSNLPEISLMIQSMGAGESEESDPPTPPMAENASDGDS